MGNCEVGKRIRFQREKLGYTQETFAEIVGVSTNYLSAVERGVKFPRLDNLIAIINGLGCSADDIFMDVIDSGYRIQATILTEQLEQLPMREQKRILAVIETMIEQANQ